MEEEDLEEAVEMDAGEGCAAVNVVSHGCDDWYEGLEYPDTFYSNADKYWKGVPSTVDGMLGGFSHLSSPDIAASRKFITRFLSSLRKSSVVHGGRALDCGAGIGRVSKRLLLPLFYEVDLLEQNPAFLEKAKTYLGASASRVGNYFAVGMQDFVPEEGRYDVIWIQWVIGHLTDDHLVSFLQRCIKGLNPKDGLIVIKDNVSSSHNIFDAEDSSVVRCTESLQEIFRRARLKVIKVEVQKDFPSSIYTVKMFALKKQF